jgi:hypothetical protein
VVHGLLAQWGALEVPLLDLAPHVPVDDLFGVFTALAAEVAARAGDAALGTWCLGHLEPRGEATIMSGLGTLVIGSARHFTGLARMAIGDLAGAAADFEAAAWMATAHGAHLWRGHSTVELAEVLAQTGRPADRERAGMLLADLRNAVPTSPRLARRCDEVAELAIVPVTLRHP